MSPRIWITWNLSPVVRPLTELRLPFCQTLGVGAAPLIMEVRKTNQITEVSYPTKMRDNLDKRRSFVWEEDWGVGCGG